MRTVLVASCAALSLLACGGSNPGGDDDDGVTPDAGDLPPTDGFRILTPDIEIQPGQEITYCYYFRTPNTKMLGIKRWKSEMTPGSHHMIMFTTGDTDVKPPGTVSAQGCGGGAGGGLNVPIWTYAAQTPSADLPLPADDGAGMPLGMDVAPNTAAYFQMHYLNTTDAVIKVHVQLDAEAHPDGVAYTKTAAYVTFYGNISIPPNAVGHVEPDNLAMTTCNVPAGSKFWLMSTHAHKQAVRTNVRDGGAMMFESDDWEHPAPRMHMTAPYYEFASNKLTYSCTYDNTGENSNRTVTTGDSAATDEMCMASGYFFPAAKPVFCYNNFIVPN